MEDVTKIVKVASNAAYNLELGFVPDYVEVENTTKWVTDAAPVVFKWHKNLKNAAGTDISDGGYYGMTNLASAAADGQKPVIVESNGFTAYDTGNFAARSVLIDTQASAITQASNAVVTSAAHGMSTGNKVTFQSITEGMTEIQGLSTKITYLTANTFSCDNINSTDFTAWEATLATGQFVKTGTLNQDTGKKGITLGSAIMVNADDYLIVKAYTGDIYAQVTQA